MGDVIHTLPAVASLKQSFPSAAISWVLRSQWAPLLESNASVDEVIPFERTRSGMLAAWRQIRAKRYDLVVDFQGLMQSALIARAAGAREVVGFASSQARETLSSLFYSNRALTTGPHRVDSYLQLAAAAGASNLVTDFPLPEGRPEGTLPEGPFVLASPMAGWGSKQWPLEFYGDLARLLPYPLVVNGPASAEATLRRIPGAHMHLSGISGLIDATRRASAVIGVDSGPMHLAAALKKPGVAIFGPTDPRTHGPYGGSLKVLRDPSAVTSYKRRDEMDPAMKAIRPQRVLEALVEFF